MEDKVIVVSQPFEKSDVGIGLRLRQRVQIDDAGEEFMDTSAVYLEEFHPNGEAVKDILIGANELPKLMNSLKYFRGLARVKAE